MSMYTAFNRSIEEGRTVERTTTSSVSMEIARGEALATRIKALEQKAESMLVLSHRIAVLEARIVTLEKFTAGRWGDDYFVRLSANLSVDPVEKIEGPKFDIPSDLTYNRTNYNQRPSNKTPDKVSRRWAIWKAQYESGMKMLHIAKSWGCDNGTIRYARSKNWQASTGWASK